MVSSCHFCKKIENLPYKCNYCNNFFCYDHRLVSNHLCPYYSKDKTNIYSKQSRYIKIFYKFYIEELKLQKKKYYIY